MFAFSKSWLLDFTRLHTVAATSSGGEVLVRSVSNQTISLLCVGALTTRSAAADILDCAIWFAEADPGQPLTIDWVGEGDLRGVLAAQPLPDGVVQRFLPVSDGNELAGIVAAADVVCLLSDDPRAIAPCVAAGKPILASWGSAAANLILRAHVGWLFDTRRPSTIMAALAQAVDYVRERATRDRDAAAALVAETA